MRKDLTQDADRPHFYSQFWLDVALGRAPTIGAGASAELVEEPEDDFEPLPEPPMVMAPPKAAPKKTAERERAPRALSSLADLANIDMLMKNSAEMADEAIPDIESAGLGSDQTGEPLINVQLADEAAAATAEEPGILAAESEQPAEELADFDADEEEEEDEWGGGRKPRPRKLPPRRDRRGF